MALKDAGKRAIQNGVDNLTDFKHGNVSGRFIGVGDPLPYVGKLPEQWVTELAKLISIDEIEYILFSYQTPMAWKRFNSGEWIFPPVKYSVTTSNHQGVMRVAVDNPGFYS